MAVDSRSTPFAHGPEESLRGSPRLVDVLRVGECFLSRANGIELGGKDLLTVEQQIDAVCPADGRSRIGLHGRRKGRIPDRDFREEDGCRSSDARGQSHSQQDDKREGYAAHSKRLNADLTQILACW